MGALLLALAKSIYLATALCACYFYTRKINDALHQIQEFGKQGILLQSKVFSIFCKQSYEKYARNLYYS